MSIEKPERIRTRERVWHDTRYARHDSLRFAARSVGGCSSSSNDGAGSGGGGGGSDAGATFDGDVNGGDGGTTITTSDGGTFSAGNPDGTCSTGVPAGGLPVDTSHPTTTVGTGDAASCTFDALKHAVTAGGIIAFNCGSLRSTITVTATLNLPIDKDTVIDGGKKITLDGGGDVEVLIRQPGLRHNESRVTLQHIALVGGKTTPTRSIPTGARRRARKATTTAKAAGSTCATATSRSSIRSSRTTRPRSSDPTRAAAALPRGQQARRARSFRARSRATKQQRRRIRIALRGDRRLRQPLHGQRRDRARREQRRSTLTPVPGHEQRAIRDRLRRKRRRALQRRRDRHEYRCKHRLCGDKITRQHTRASNAFGGGVFFTSNDWSARSASPTHDDRQYRRTLDEREERQRDERGRRGRHERQEHHDHQLDDSRGTLSSS